MNATGNDTDSLMTLALKLKQCCQTHEHAIVARAALTPGEYTCLRAMPLEAPIGATALAQAMGLSPSRASRLVERLVRRRLLERRDDERDRRVALLSLSRAGRALKSELDECLADCDQRLRRALSPKERTRAREGLSLVLRALEAP